MMTEGVCLHSQTLDNRGVLTGLSLQFLEHFAIAKSFFGALYNIGAIIGLT